MSGTAEQKAARAAYDATPEARAKRAAYRAAPETKAYMAAYRATPEAKAARAAYAKIHGSAHSVFRQSVYSAGDLTSSEWNAIVEAHENICHYCDDPAEHLDHIHPISRGGLHTASNVVPACAPCNLSKGSKTLDEWPNYQGRTP